VTSAATPAATSTKGAKTSRAQRFRPDIEGLRAVAVLLVLIYHAGLHLPNGYFGVDVFFVISGFLITGLLVRELTTTGTISWTRFVGRRIRRLLPAAVLVLGVTAAVGWFVVPGLRRRELGGDIAAAAVYVVNWRFAAKDVDPPTLEVRQSAVQHFWSLAVEEQFYVVWPLALIALALVLRRFGRRPTVSWVAAVLAVVAVPSFAYAVWLAPLEPSRAYVVTTTRAWELGIGCALALWCAAGQGNWESGRRSAMTRAVVGWVGLAAVVASALWLPKTGGYPGPLTLVPTLGAAAVIWSGTAGDRWGPVRLLGTAPMVWIGGLSYSLYLWHWPAVILTEWWHRGLTGPEKVAVVVASAVPAWASHRFLEAPIHHSRALARRARPVLALGLGLSLAGVAVAVPLLLAPSAFRTAPASAVRPPVTELGAAALGTPGSRQEGADGRAGDPAAYDVDAWDWVTPDPQLAGRDRTDAETARCLASPATVRAKRCDFGDPNGSVRIALVGDSATLQWLPALQELAAQRGWRVETYAKSACELAAGQAQRRGLAYPQCDRWNDAVMARLRAEPPDLVVTSGHATTAWDGRRPTTAAMTAGWAQRWRELAAAGIPVAVLGDSPASPGDVDVCAARNAATLRRCAFDRDAAVTATALPQQREAVALAATPAVRLVDLTDWICPGERCPLVVGNVAVHRPADHLTATYVRTLAPVLGRALDEQLADPATGRVAAPGGAGAD
jgi:peptidoglycan/LPS O-acetylase OafA/YrhL